MYQTLQQALIHYWYSLSGQERSSLNNLGINSPNDVAVASLPDSYDDTPYKTPYGETVGDYKAACARANNGGW